MMNSNFIRLEPTKTKLTGTSFEVTSVDSNKYDSSGVANPNYGDITITGIATLFSSELSTGDVIQLCTDATFYQAYTSSTITAYAQPDIKYSMQFETVLEEYKVTAIASNTSMTVEVYTDYEEEFDRLTQKAADIYVNTIKKAVGSYDPIKFYTAYIKPLINNKPADYIVNIAQIANFHINTTNPQNMDLHMVDTGTSHSRDLDVHNCFDYLNYVLQPYTVIEKDRVFFNYSEPDLTMNQPELYDGYVYAEDRPRVKRKAQKELDKAKKNLDRENKIREYKHHG